MPLYSDEEIERLARRRAGAKMGWYIHLPCTCWSTCSMFACRGTASAPALVGVPLWAGAWGWRCTASPCSCSGKGSGFRERLMQRERERLLQQRERDRAAGR
jgi:hypothetical protein